MTEPDFWSKPEVWAAIWQCVAALAAVVGLPFIGKQIRAARLSADLQSLQTFYRDAQEHERALIAAPTSAAKDQAFVEFLNFLELYAAAVNGGLFPKVSRRIATEKLRDSIAVITEMTDWHDKLQDAITSAYTFNSLRDFTRREKAAIESIVKSRAANSA